MDGGGDDIPGAAETVSVVGTLLLILGVNGTIAPQTAELRPLAVLPRPAMGETSGWHPGWQRLRRKRNGPIISNQQPLTIDEVTD